MFVCVCVIFGVKYCLGLYHVVVVCVWLCLYVYLVYVYMYVCVSVCCAMYMVVKISITYICNVYIHILYDEKIIYVDAILYLFFNVYYKQ